jgi:hypothetical protein
MKRMIFITVAVMAVILAATINVRLNLAKTLIMSNMTLQNLEAFGDESSSESAYECLMKKDKCKFTATTSVALEILKKVPGFSTTSLNVEVDLSDGTKLHYKPSFFWFWEGALRCGQDIICNDLLRQSGLLKYKSTY